MIPKSFTLVNRTWVVRRVTSKQLEDHLKKDPINKGLKSKDLQGLCDPNYNRIFINTDLHVSEENMEQTFWHEFVHALKFSNGEDDHCEIEVDRIGGFLHQFHQTKKGEPS